MPLDVPPCYGTATISSAEVCPLAEATGEFGPQLVHKSSLTELQQLKIDQRSYTNNPDGYIVSNMQQLSMI